jgi:signal transduction histidine kinase
MTRTINPDTDLMASAQYISETLLKKAPLTNIQRSDIDAINAAARQFIAYAQANLQSIMSSEDTAELQSIRHRLRNHLNIIVGFSRLLVRELPDNLLLHMLLLRQIHETGEMLIVRVDDIR